MTYDPASFSVDAVTKLLTKVYRTTEDTPDALYNFLEAITKIREHCNALFEQADTRIAELEEDSDADEHHNSV